MNTISKTLYLFLLLGIASNTQAQLGGLLKKTKDKVTEKK
jgi:hypothetical protein